MGSTSKVTVGSEFRPWVKPPLHSIIDISPWHLEVAVAVGVLPGKHHMYNPCTFGWGLRPATAAAQVVGVATSIGSQGGPVVAHVPRLIIWAPITSITRDHKELWAFYHLWKHTHTHEIFMILFLCVLDSLRTYRLRNHRVLYFAFG